MKTLKDLEEDGWEIDEDDITQADCPPAPEQKNRIFCQYFTDDGSASGSNDMLVDGSITPVEFWIPAHPSNDRYITTVNFLIADSRIFLNQFGGVEARTDGCDFEYSGAGEPAAICGPLKTNWDFIRLCHCNPMTPGGFVANNVSGVSEGVCPTLDFSKIMPPYGLKLDAGSGQKLVIRVNDDCTDPDEFNAVAHGFERFE